MHMYMYVYVYMLCYAKSLQSCPTLCDPIDSRPPGYPVSGILQARTLESVAISFHIHMEKAVAPHSSTLARKMQGLSYGTPFFRFNKHLPIFKCLSRFNDKNKYIAYITKILITSFDLRIISNTELHFNRQLLKLWLT